MTEMASRLPTYRSLVPQLASALDSFRSSGSKFRVLKTVTPSNLSPQDPSSASAGDSPKTLFILDSSFNPPSIAHQTLAASALHKSCSDGHPKPHRLLLLFATMNAEKAPSAAAFEQRLTLMTVFAADLLQTLKDSKDHSTVSIDIGVTSLPYYTDKSAAINTEGTEWYPSKPAHVHLVGYDTITRFFAPKYYPKFDPPLSALDPYFEAGHGLRVTLRPDNEFGTIEEQRAFVKRLETGEMEAVGGKKEWVKQVELVEPNARSGVSSTKIRKAAKRGDWEEVGELCTPGVVEYVKSEGLYADDDRASGTPYTKARPLALLYRNPHNNIQTTITSIPPPPNLPQANTLTFKVTTTRDIMENLNIVLIDTAMSDAPADDFQLSSADWTTAMDEVTTFQDATSATSITVDDTAMADDTIVDTMEISSADDTTALDEDTPIQEDDTDMSDDADISFEDCTVTADDASATEQTHTATSSLDAEDDTLMVDVDDSVDTIEALLKSF
ncbi:hypothetical protein LTR97_004890 [Elasticomyces elasticus]|uniref:Nicotinamide-nucleotide adenylyltransferase n=1 Tax=Elasticomyces elasticus TaxID=574655 RepID=A0AAN7WMN0_9PEZI|nr:hypothetical protein LTR97_004890 [Elasticomyces elasticus]